jgi:ATP-binding cassette subfamily C (CFTR/MRP) protein 1
MASLILLPLSLFEHVRSLQPSPLISTYLLFSALLDIPQARTLFLQQHVDLCTLFVASLVLKTVILALEQKDKRPLLKAPYRSYPPEALSGIISRSLFWWLNSLFVKGHRRLLKFSDLYETDPELSSTLLHNKISKTWKRYYHRKGKNSLVLACIACFKRPLLATVFPRLCVIGFKFCQPLLIQRAISFLGEPRNEETENIGRSLIGATALIYVGLGIMTARYRHMIYRTVTMVRGGLICLIFDATLRLDGVTAGESAAVTLMSTDIDRIAQGIELSDNLWAAPIEIAIAIFLLQRQLGLACLAPAAIAIGLCSLLA